MAEKKTQRKGRIAADGTVLEHGFVELEPGPGETIIDLPEEFHHEAGSVRIVDARTEPVERPKKQAVLNLQGLVEILKNKGLVTQEEIDEVVGKP